MSLVVCNWGGHIHASNSEDSPIEIWSNTIALIGPLDPDVEGLVSLVQSPLEDWFQRASTLISATVSLDYLKINEYNIATGHQITDPTNEQFLSGLRGAVESDYSPPVTQSYRVSMDDRTRNRSARGGFFVPRVDAPIRHDGTWVPLQRDDAVGSAQTFMSELNTITDYTVAVWSRKDTSMTAVQRLRVGSIPDNMSSRKNALIETYSVAAL